MRPSIAATAELIRRRAISPVEVLQECLETIERLNPVLNAFITVTAESAMRQARAAETEIARGGWRGPLHGIPIGLKDLIDTAGVRTTAASALFRDRVPAEDADVVRKLKTAGAVLIGKHNLHEFAYGGSSLISEYGPVRNPVNPDCVAGGSSGGSAAAVACGMCYAAIGTDTAGSIREPAALCGVVGLKPSYALVSARGVIPLSVSLDHVGPITRTVEDAAIVLDAIAERPGDYVASSGRPLGRKVLGIPRNHFYENLDSSVGACAERAITEFQNLGFELREINVPVDTDRTLQIAEAYAFHRERLAESQELYDPETLRRIRAGENISQDAYRDSAERLQKTRGEISHIFHRIDALITPTTPIPAPGIGDLTEDPTHLRPIELVLLRNTRPVNIWGLPAISVPCGFTTKGLPIGLQIIGRPQGESEVIGISQAYERQKCFGC